jgi:hypothetical protein
MHVTCHDVVQDLELRRLALRSVSGAAQFAELVKVDDAKVRVLDIHSILILFIYLICDFIASVRSTLMSINRLCQLLIVNQQNVSCTNRDRTHSSTCMFLHTCSIKGTSHDCLMHYISSI